jgi:hypothetical protein
MIGVAGQSKPRLLSRSSRPAAAAFRIDQDARRVDISKTGTFHTWPRCTGMSVSEDRADNNMKRSNVCRWCLPKPDCHRRRRRTFRNYRENCRARDHRPGRDRTRSSRWSSGGSEQPDDACDAWHHNCWPELPVVLGRLNCSDCSEGPTHHSSPHLTQR